MLFLIGGVNAYSAVRLWLRWRRSTRQLDGRADGRAAADPRNPGTDSIGGGIEGGGSFGNSFGDSVLGDGLLLDGGVEDDGSPRGSEENYKMLHEFAHDNDLEHNQLHR